MSTSPSPARRTHRPRRRLHAAATSDDDGDTATATLGASAAVAVSAAAVASSSSTAVLVADTITAGLPQRPTQEAAAAAGRVTRSAAAAAAAAASSALDADAERRAAALAALFVAASAGDFRGARCAVRQGADVNFVAGAVDSVCACRLAEEACVCLGYSPLHCAVQAGSMRTVRALVELSADVSARSGRMLFATRLGDGGPSAGLAAPSPPSPLPVDGLTPLHVAAACGHRGVVELLLKCLADPRAGAVEPVGRTPLGFVLAGDGGRAQDPGVVDLLRGACTARLMERVISAASAPPGSVEAFIGRQGSGPCPAGEFPTLAASARIEDIRRRVRARHQLEPGGDIDHGGADRSDAVAAVAGEALVVASNPGAMVALKGSMGRAAIDGGA